MFFSLCLAILLQSHCQLQPQYSTTIMLKIHAVPAFTDNYIWLIEAEQSSNVLVVDPGDAMPVLEALKQKNLNPIAVLITHHHYDHIDGIRSLLDHYPIPVYGPETEQIPGKTFSLSEQKDLIINAEFPTASILDIAGHTSGHIAYLFGNHLFCGDTLFSAGCGRLLGGTAEQLFSSLERISQLPKDTFIFCAHEYTEANLKFAQTVEPGNPAIEQRIKEVELLRNNNKATVPTRLDVELATNPFLRCRQPQVIQSAQDYAGRSLTTPLAVFTALRLWKDQFRA